jgi:hydroxymethylpyrimidine pyrophosphatase-like HAD family hydrolase
MVNWTHVSIVMVFVVILIGIGIYLFLDKTDVGQKIMARLGQDATAAAMWEVGQEAMDTGDMDRAIAMFETAQIGIAVSNACPEALAAADYITVSNEEHAVARVIYDLQDGYIK